MDHFFKGQWGSTGTGDGQFKEPDGIAVDSDGNVYVVDTNNHRIQKFTRKGVFLDKWGSYGSGDGQFNHPTGITVDSNDDIYVTDEKNHRIQKFSRTGDFTTKWGSYGSGNGQFKHPYGMAVESDDDIVVVDMVNCRIQKFTSDGDFIRKWGHMGVVMDNLIVPEVLLLIPMMTFTLQIHLIIMCKNFHVPEISLVNGDQTLTFLGSGE